MYTGLGYQRSGISKLLCGSALSDSPNAVICSQVSEDDVQDRDGKQQPMPEVSRQPKRGPAGTRRSGPPPADRVDNEASDGVGGGPLDSIVEDEEEENESEIGSPTPKPSPSQSHGLLAAHQSPGTAAPPSIASGSTGGGGGGPKRRPRPARPKSKEP